MGEVSTKKRRKPNKLAVPFIADMLEEAEIPDYQAYIQHLAQSLWFKLTGETGLTEEQIRLALVVADVRIPRIVARICEIALVSRQTYYNARQNPAWVAFQNKLARQVSDQYLPDVWATLTRVCQTGDVKAIRLFFELRGDLKIQIEQSTVTETHEQRLARQRAQARLGDGGEEPASQA